MGITWNKEPMWEKKGIPLPRTLGNSDLQVSTGSIEEPKVTQLVQQVVDTREYVRGKVSVFVTEFSAR